MEEQKSMKKMFEELSQMEKEEKEIMDELLKMLDDLTKPQTQTKKEK